MTREISSTGSMPTGLQRRDLYKVLAFAGSVVGGIGLPQSVAAAPARSSPPAPMWVPDEMPSPVPVTEGMVDVGGVKLWYWDTGGNGQPVIFMHTGSQSGAGWGYQQPAFAAADFEP
jgi:hypothetical protein